MVKTSAVHVDIWVVKFTMTIIEEQVIPFTLPYPLHMKIIIRILDNFRKWNNSQEEMFSLSYNSSFLQMIDTGVSSCFLFCFHCHPSVSTSLTVSLISTNTCPPILQSTFLPIVYLTSDIQKMPDDVGLRSLPSYRT